MKQTLSVGELAKAASVSAKTIRYYEQVGVLPVPHRSMAGYRQYTPSDVHRLLFIRRARTLGLSLPSIKTLTVELDQGQCLTMRPRLTAVVTEHLRTVQQQRAELQLLERQLTQVLHRLLTLPALDHTQGCHCLEVEAVAPGTPQQPSVHLREGEKMSAPDTLESLTLLTATEEHCGCGCGCGALLQVESPQANPGQEGGVQFEEIRTGNGTRR
jgi:DNA-binding transcriptional MerR regulator